MKSASNIIRIVATLLLVLSLQAWGAAKYGVLHAFGRGKDGAGPFGLLTLDNQGNLYGVTGGGGDGCSGGYGCGVVFELMPHKNGLWGEKLLFQYSGDGTNTNLWGGLALDGTGNLYGTLQGQGSGVFDLSHGSSGWNFGVLYSDGAGPGVLIDGLGNLYGDIGPGQYKYYGAIAELSPGSTGWTYTQLYSFCGQSKCPDGYDLPAPPVWDRQGNMFGTTVYGGIGQPACWIAYGCGVVFEMTSNGDGTRSYTVLHRFLQFSEKDGQTPEGGLVMDASGNFYGTTVYGGKYNVGMVFRLRHTAGSWRLENMYDFPDCKIGCAPAGTLVLDKAGNLYGEAGGGLVDCGPDSCGVLFKLSPQKSGKWKYSVVHKFNGKDGGFPGYGLIVDGKGNLFGVTTSFGKYGYGVAFKLTP
jgi:uncharacterized repeat protein (TIGR03803 family)